MRRLAGLSWAGRLLLVGSVLFWWGGIVVPHVLSMVSPARLPPDSIPRHLNPEFEGTIANTVSAGALLTVALLALLNAVVSRRRAAGWMAVGGWAALAVTAAYLASEEISDFHATGLTAVELSVFGTELLQEVGPNLWVPLLSPLIVVFGLAMGVLIRKELRAPAVRTPFVLGLIAWLLAVAHEASDPFVFEGRGHALEVLLEETLEFSGALLISLSAAIALRCDMTFRPLAGMPSGRYLRKLVIAAVIGVAVLGGVVVAFVFRVPVVDARTPVYTDTFEISLREREALVQEFRMPVPPLGVFALRLANRDPNGRSGSVAVRVVAAGTSGPLLSGGRVEVPAGTRPQWRSVYVSTLAEVEGRPLDVWVVADIHPGAELRIGATQTNRYPSGRLWINDTLAWPNRNLEFVAYSAAAPTPRKFEAIWRLMTSDWRWPVLAVDAAISLTLITLVPSLLIASALPRGWSPSNRPPPRPEAAAV